MDVRRWEELKQDLLDGRFDRHRRLLVTVCLFAVAFFGLILVGGYVLVTHAMDDNHVTSTRGINTPTQVSLLFAGHNPNQLVNSLVYLNRVKIEPVSDAAKIYYAGDDSGTRLLVVAHQPSAPSEESVANVMGTIRPLTSDLIKKWKLSKEQQKAVKSQGVYLDVESLKVHHPAATMAKR